MFFGQRATTSRDDEREKAQFFLRIPYKKNGLVSLFRKKTFLISLSIEKVVRLSISNLPP